MFRELMRLEREAARMHDDAPPLEPDPADAMLLGFAGELAHGMPAVRRFGVCAARHDG